MRRTLSVLWLPGLVLWVACSAPSPTPPKGPEQPGEADKVSLGHPDEVHLADIVQLTRGGENAEAYWSFDGTELIFQTTRPPYSCDQIMRMPADGSGEPTLVSTGTGRTTCAYFLPGDKEVVYSSTHEAGPDCPPTPDHSKGYVWPLYDTFEIYRANVDGTGLRKITDRKGYDAEATVCAKDGSIIFTSDRDGDLELYRMDADGNNVVRLTSTPGYDGGAFFSADCSKILWRASRPEGAELEDFRALLAQGLVRPSKLEIFVANADGSDARQITYLGAASFAPYFHPSSRRVLFSTNHGDPQGREFDIWAVDVDGSNLERITYAPGFDGFPMFSPDGTKLAFASNRNQANPGDTDVYVARWVESPRAGAEPGTVERIRDAITWLADDAREGRGVGTAGLEESAAWIETAMKDLGTTGGADASGAYRQSFEVPVALERGEATSLAIDGKAVAADDFVPAGFSAVAEVSGKTVFAGYGIVDKELGIDHYKGVAARGKIVVVRRFVPAGTPFDDPAVHRRLSDIQYKAFIARERGAVALVVVDAPEKPAKDAEPDAPLPALVPSGHGDAGIPVLVVSRAAGAGLIGKKSHALRLSVALERKTATVHNIVAKLPAGAAQRSPGAVIIGAHYDHLGHGGHGSLDQAEVIHNGADDNASGVATLLEIGRSLAARQAQLGRDVYLVAFSAEESGVLGSTHFVAHLPAGLDKGDIAAMLNLDMVGRMQNNHISVIGTKTALEWAEIVEPACAAARVRCTLGGDGYGPSDHMPFYSAGAPVLHFFTGSHGDYHKGSDDTDRINAVGAARIAELVALVAESIAGRHERLSFERAPMPAGMAGPMRGDMRATGASMGTIPAYGDTGTTAGVLLGDVRAGAAAEKAGLKSGDRIIRIDATQVRSIQDFMFILRAAKPGQKAKVTVLRDGKEASFDLTYDAPRRRAP